MKASKTIEGLVIVHGKPNDCFYTTKKDNYLTALSTYHSVKIKTERQIVVDPKSLESKYITKVTLL